MNWSSKPIFIYCFIFSLVLVASGVHIILTKGSWVAFLTSVPIATYFIAMSYRTVVQKRSLPLGPDSAHADFIITVVLVALIAGSGYMIFFAPKEKQSPIKLIDQPESKGSPANTPVPSARKITIKQDVEGAVRVRSKPSTSSDILHKAYAGDSFVELSREGGWIQVQLPKLQSGWISTEFVSEMTK